MDCAKCGLPLLGTETFCPQCGARIAEEPAAEPPAPGELEAGLAPETTEESEPPVVEAADVSPVAAFAEEAPTSSTPMAESGPAVLTPQVWPQRRYGRLVGPLGLGILAGCLVFFVIGLAALGLLQGMRLRARTQNEIAARHYSQGLAHLEKGEYEMAAAEFEWVLRLRPDYPGAKEKLIEARSKAASQLTPTPQGAQNRSPTLLTEGKAAYDRGAWDEAIQKLEALQALDPNYEQVAVQRLLVGAYTNSGLKLVSEDRLEEAIRRFDQALNLQPDNPDVRNQLRLATLYQSAISSWGVNWGQAIKQFSALYALKPDYKDTARRLQQANVQAGDAAAARAAWCEALQYYKAALGLASSPELAAKRDDAARHCASPTAVPGTAVPSGTFVGTFNGYEDIQQRTRDWAQIHGHVLNAKGEPVPNVKIRLSAFDWSATADTDTSGYYSFELLNKEVTFTVSLVNVPTQPVDVKARFGYAGIADFREK